MPPPSEAHATYIRRCIYNEAWYPRLLILWYGLALAFGSDLLYLFPYVGQPETEEVFVAPDSLTITQSYFIWLGLDAGILWTPTVFLIDPITRYFWSKTWVGQKFSEQPWPTLAWALLLSALLFVSVYSTLTFFHTTTQIYY